MQIGILFLDKTGLINQAIAFGDCDSETLHGLWDYSSVPNPWLILFVKNTMLTPLWWKWNDRFNLVFATDRSMHWPNSKSEPVRIIQSSWLLVILFHRKWIIQRLKDSFSDNDWVIPEWSEPLGPRGCHSVFFPIRSANRCMIAWPISKESRLESPTGSEMF